MQDTRRQQTESVELDIKRVMGTLWQKKLLLALCAVVCAVVFLVGTLFLIKPQYQSAAMFYVNNYAKMGESTGSITSSDITASKNLVDSYIVILNARTSLESVIEYAGVNRSVEDLEDMLKASSVNSTEIFRVVVTSTDPDEALKIAEAVADVLPKRIASILEGSSAYVVDEPVLAEKPSGPNYALNTALGFVLGLVLCLIVVVLQELFDVTVRADEDITGRYDLPILASVPDMHAHTKEGYYSYRSQPEKTTPENKDAAKVGAGVSFAAAEAYKLLRTKVQFSFADESNCHVIGVSSAMAGEGKSTTAANLAFTLAQLNNRVLLIDCDLRKPTVHSKLAVQPNPGISDHLARQIPLAEVIQRCELDESLFDVISAGRVPPNPIELISSERMLRAIDALKGSYNYIILDLPPISEVSDALVAARMMDGMLLVVRQNYCNRRRLEDTIRQLEFVGVRVLGFLQTCAADRSFGYKKYYKKYYYGGYYASAGQSKKSGKKKSGGRK